MKQRRKPSSPSPAEPDESAVTSLPPEAASRIVSSAHLVSERCPQLSEFEFGMILAVNAFSRWVVRCMTAAGFEGMTTMEALLLHHVHHRARKKKLADICFMYNIEDTHVVSYSLKKLVDAGLVKSEKSGKEVLFSTTEEGARLVESYRRVRENCLINQLSGESRENQKIGEMAQFLRYLSALYDQAARAATSL